MAELQKQVCPVCGTGAEVGCVYASDRSILFWREGEPTWGKNVFGMFGKAKRVGTAEFLKGTHAAGTRCLNCKNIVIPILKGQE